jgi:uncharacterized membrane protein YedE/YeeE
LTDTTLTTTHLVAWLAFLLALIFGYVANKTSFCTMGAISDVVNMGVWGRMRAWLLAMSVAILGTNILVYLGYLHIVKTIYTRESFDWLAALVGGIAFGIGMTLASGCGQRTLVRVGGGNLKSVVVFIFLGYSALVTLNGVFREFADNVLRADLFTIDLRHMQTVPDVLHIGSPGARLLIASAICLAILAFVFSSREFRVSSDNILSGFTVGLVVVGGWYVTGTLGFGENEYLEMAYLGTDSRLAESMSFVGPLAYTMDLFVYWRDKHVTFGVACVFGVVAGSFLYSVAHRTFRWEYFTSPQDMFRHIIGAILMGFGGVTAAGCTIGQGVTGLSTLALSSILALSGIIAGAAATMKIEYRILVRNG